MIKISPLLASQTSFTPLSSLKHSHSYRNSVQLSPLCISEMNKKNDHFPSSTIIADSSQFEKLKQILEWRQNTEFPIVKIRSYKLSNEKQTLQCKFLQILVQLQGQMKSLVEMKTLPFFQAIYVLKQSMIGFERLCHHFGFFTPEAQMIKFNENQNCKVWINEDCFSNVTSLGNVKSERQFVLELCNIVERQTVKSRTSISFFERIRTCKYFFEAICSIDTYAKTNRIIIPSRLQNLDDVKSPLLKTSLTTEFNLKQNKSKNNLVKSGKIPQFIKKNKVKKTVSYDINSPLPRKMTTCTQECIYDRSLTNISRNNSTNSFLKNDCQERRIERDQDDLIEEDSFLKDMNIRLIEPNSDERKIIPFSSPHFTSQYDNIPECPTSPFGRVSEINYDEDKRSGFSFNRCISKDQIPSFETAERLFLTVHKPTNHTDTYSSSPKKKAQYSPRCIKTLQYLDDQESFQEYQRPYVKENKFTPLSISEIRDKRKFSADFVISPGQIKTENKFVEREQTQLLQSKTHNHLLNIPHPTLNNQCLTKSPSHQVISKPQHQPTLDSDSQEKQDRQFLRETIMNKNGWKGLELLNDPSTIKISFVDNVEIPYAQCKTSELPKLGGMGRNVRSSMINECEFQLEYGGQIQKEKFVRDEIMNILD